MMTNPRVSTQPNAHSLEGGRFAARGSATACGLATGALGRRPRFFAVAAALCSLVFLFGCESDSGSDADAAVTSPTTGGTEGGGGSEATGGSNATGGSSNTGGSSATGGASGGPGNAASLCRAPSPVEAPGSGTECTGDMPTGLTLTEVAQGFNEPVYATFAPGDEARLFIVERAGVIRIIDDGSVLDEPFLDITPMVETGGGEQGLLGLAFDPNYAETGRFWVNFVESQGQIPFTVVGSFRVSSDDPNVADPNSLERLFEVRQPASNHNGGTVLFGPDDCLYVGFGDGGEANDPWNNAQTLDDHVVAGEEQSGLLGKMVRVDPAIYPDPAPGNMTGDGVNPHLWDYGLRNPFRFSFDAQTGDLYIGDVGQNTWEEVDVEPVGTGHFNYGWRITEGLHCRGETGDGGGCSFDGLRNPVAEYDNPPEQNTSRAVLGGFVYRGGSVPQLEGRYLYADYVTQQIWTFVYSGEGAEGAEICDEFELTDQLPVGSQLRSFGIDAAGEIYILTGNGRVLRIDSE